MSHRICRHSCEHQISTCNLQWIWHITSALHWSCRFPLRSLTCECLLPGREVDEQSEPFKSQNASLWHKHTHVAHFWVSLPLRLSEKKIRVHLVLEHDQVVSNLFATWSLSLFVVMSDTATPLQDVQGLLWYPPRRNRTSLRPGEFFE